MTENTTENLIYIAAAILLPLFPAYILYKSLPARTSVKGPFQGLNIKLSGAFGGYFLLVLVIFGFIFSSPRKPIVQQIIKPYEVYKVEGLINIREKKHIEQLSLSILPSGLTMIPNGTFDFVIPVRHEQMGTEEFPSLVIDHPEYETETVELREESLSERSYSIEYDKDNKVIRITGGIQLKRKDEARPYNPDQQLQPVNKDSEDK